jgi:hypothetical protein
MAVASNQACHAGAVTVAVFPSLGVSSGEVNAGKDIAGEVRVVCLHPGVDDCDGHPLTLADLVSDGDVKGAKVPLPISVGVRRRGRGGEQHRNKPA